MGNPLTLKVIENPNCLWVVKEHEPHMNKAGWELETISNSIYVFYHKYLYMSSLFGGGWGAGLPPILA
jgi:hypothetical protein